MKSQVPVSFALLISLIIVPLVFCDEDFDALKVFKMNCICSQNSEGSKSCDCSQGSSGQYNSWKTWIYSKPTVIFIIVFGLIMTLAFIASVACKTYRENKYPVRGVSSFKEANINMTKKLINLRSSSNQEYKVCVGAPNKPIIGVIRSASLFRNKRKKLPGLLERFSYSELEEATEKFLDSSLIGVGGSSHVYYGQLNCGKTVAIKRLKNWGGQDFDTIFLTEIELLSRLHHVHVVPLLGYCSENQGRQVERLLVYEYMPNGNLRECLNGASGIFLDWSRRVAIALGAAKGLEYLHEAAAPKILHRDVKSSNILLDEKLIAKITDLGVAKHLMADDLASGHNSPAKMMGTFGYFAPEYVTLGRGSLKSDVFSFGVVLLELITGREPINRVAPKGEESLVLWATPRLHDSQRVIKELPDPQLNGDFQEEEMQIMAYLAKECLLLDPDSRPSMSEAVQILSTIDPERTRRQHFPITIFQSSFCNIKSDDDIERADKHVETEKPKETTPTRSVSDRYSLPLHIDRTLCSEKNSIIDVFSEDIDRLILLATKETNMHSYEDEVVDISEPRFESFCIEYERHSV